MPIAHFPVSSPFHHSLHSTHSPCLPHPIPSSSPSLPSISPTHPPFPFPPPPSSLPSPPISLQIFHFFLHLLFFLHLPFLHLFTNHHIITMSFTRRHRSSHSRLLNDRERGSVNC